MKICIHGRFYSGITRAILLDILKEARSKQLDISFTDSFYGLASTDIPEIQQYPQIKDKNDLKFTEILISIGGDGTLLETVTLAGRLQIPILGVNTGRLGFLTSTTDLKMNELFFNLIQKNYTIDERALISFESPGQPFGELNFGLNEFAILKSDTSSMITVHTHIDGNYLNSYWADGIVVSTPTGSTGYSLSCGGPVVVPRSNNFIITPVSAHNLSVRPIVVSDKSDISFEVESRSGHYLISLDSRSHVVYGKMPIHVKRESFTIKLVKFRDYNYFDTLRQKLNWGLDIRN